MNSDTFTAVLPVTIWWERYDGMQEINDCVIVTTVESLDDSGPPAAVVTEALLQQLMSAFLLLYSLWVRKKKALKSKFFNDSAWNPNEPHVCPCQTTATAAAAFDQHWRIEPSCGERSASDLSGLSSSPVTAQPLNLEGKENENNSSFGYC